MEVRGAQLLHSLDETKHHHFVTAGITFCRLFMVSWGNQSPQNKVQVYIIHIIKNDQKRDISML